MSGISVSLPQAMQTMHLFIHLFTASIFLWSCKSAFLPSPAILLQSCFTNSPTQNILSSVKAEQNRESTYLFNLLLMFVPRLYSLPWRSHLESSKKSLQCREKSVVCKVLLCWGCPNEQEVCRTGSCYSPSSLPEGFTWNEQPCKRLWKAQTM